MIVYTYKHDFADFMPRSRALRESFPEGGWNFHRDIDKFGALQKNGHGVAATGNRKTMSNQVIEVQVQGDFIERLTSARPVQALAELV
jgi:hypothetical protein